MSAEARRFRPGRALAWFSLAAITYTILAFDIENDAGATIHEARPDGIDRNGLAQFFEQLERNQWDPEDPNDFKKIIRMVLALGIPISVVAGLLNLRPNDVEHLAQGGVPKTHPQTIVGTLMRVLRRILK